MAGVSRNRRGKCWWSFDALLGADELLTALGRFPTLTIFTEFRRVPAGETGVVSLEEYVANYEKYVQCLTGGPAVDGRVGAKLSARMTLDASIITYSPHPDPAYQMSYENKPLLRVSAVEMAYFRDADRMRTHCSDFQNPIHFGLSFSHADASQTYRGEASNPEVRSRYPNIDLIEGLGEWVRENSEPCKIRLRAREQVLPVRLGRGAARWVNEHTALARQGISVRTSRPVRGEPSWLTTSVIELARAIREEKDYALLPILADALEDAGCADDAALRHCRGQHEHVRGCWVVDMLLADR